jgi:hypothetical protein
MNPKIIIYMLLCLATFISANVAAQQTGTDATSDLNAYRQLFGSAQAAAQYTTPGTYGSKVQAGDSDVGLPLSQFSGQQLVGCIFYWDIGATSGIYDDKDVAYLRFSATPPAQVQANNIRLTAWDKYPAGSYVKPGDSDIGQALIMPQVGVPPLNIWTSFYYLDVTGGRGYDLGDPVYLKIQGPWLFPPTLATNDIRITPIAGFQAGSRISIIDPDAGKILYPFDLWAPGIARSSGGPIPASVKSPIAQFAFFNANGNTDLLGNPIYDEGDVVYFDVTPGFADPVASPNDVRLF